MSRNQDKAVVLDDIFPHRAVPELRAELHLTMERIACFQMVEVARVMAVII